MNFNEHSNLIGEHAFLSPSKYHWINYSDEKLLTTYSSHLAKVRGDRLHAFAEEAIRLGVKLPRSRKTLNMYVNDAIGYKMTPEQPLFYSENCFGTTDAISFRKNFLRIHDLKTGVTPGSFHQLKIYTALFCLEYDISIHEIDVELRIYQSDDILVEEPIKEDILYIRDKIITFDKYIDKIRADII